MLLNVALMKRAAITILLLLATSFATLRSAPPAASAQQQDQVLRAIKELQEQQAAIAANQAKIEEKIAMVSEAVRQARIFASRGGHH